MAEVRKGRPSLQISQTELQTAQDRNFSIKQMATHFHCSKSQINVLLKRFGMSQRQTFSTASDAELDAIVGTLRLKFPNAGEKMMTAFLLTEGHRVQRQRVRDTLRRVEGDAVDARRSKAIARRTYTVPSPNHLWHMDGHLKLIRWGFTTHGCIDGFSRLIVFLTTSLNNRASTVFNLFLGATLKFGLPALVRSDHGGENRHVALFQNLVSGDGHHLTGKSVHNQRIERLWRDVHHQVTKAFYGMFYKLEDEGKLDIHSTSDLQALHSVYLPEINRRLQSFQDAWNKHGLRTERNRSPEQLWLQGSLEHAQDDTTAMRNIFSPELSIRQRLQHGLQAHGLDFENFEDIEELEPELELPGFIAQQDISDEEKFLLAKSYF